MQYSFWFSYFRGTLCVRCEFDLFRSISKSFFLVTFVLWQATVSFRAYFHHQKVSHKQLIDVSSRFQLLKPCIPSDQIWTEQIRVSCFLDWYNPFLCWCEIWSPYVNLCVFDICLFTTRTVWLVIFTTKQKKLNNKA